MAERVMYYSPSISIVIATYNRTKSLARLLDNIYSQRCFDFNKLDIAVVDDGSFTAEVVTINSGIKTAVVSRDRGDGARVYSSRNIGARETHGDFILQLDDDLEFSPYLLNLLQTSAALTNGRDFVWTARISNNADVDKDASDGSRGKDGRWFDGKAEWVKFDFGGCSSAGMFMPRYTWNKIGGYREVFDGAMGEADQCIALDAQKAGAEIYIAPYFVNVSDEETGSYRMDMIRTRKREKTNAELFREIHPDMDEWRIGGAKYV